MAGNQNNKLIIAASNDGSIYIIENLIEDTYKIKIIKNMLFNSLMFDIRKPISEIGLQGTSNTYQIPMVLLQNKTESSTNNKILHNKLRDIVNRWVIYSLL